MTAGELIELLQAYEPEQEVMIAHQPSWPLAEVLSGVMSHNDREEPECPVHEDYLVGHTYRGPDDQYIQCHERPEVDEVDEDADSTIWLVAGGHHWNKSPYAPRWVWEG